MNPTSPEHEDDLVVERRRDAADGVVALTLARPEGGPLPRWEPGAHIDLCLGEGMTRQFRCAATRRTRAGGGWPCCVRPAATAAPRTSTSG